MLNKFYEENSLTFTPDCDYISANFEIREKNRWAESNGLEKAPTAILSRAVGTGLGAGSFLQKATTRGISSRSPSSPRTTPSCSRARGGAPRSTAPRRPSS